MKKLMPVLLISLFTVFTAFRPADDPSKLIARKWQLNAEGLRPSLAKVIKENPQAAAMDEAQVAQAVEEGIKALKAMTLEFKPDGTYEMFSTQTGTIKGTWSLSADGKELTRQSDKGAAENKPPKKFKIVKLTDKVFHFETGAPQLPELVFMPAIPQSLK